MYALHIPTDSQELLASLPFSPTCIASGYGWVCLGGYDHGTCAFIDLQHCQLFGMPSISSTAEVDELLQLGLDPVFSRLLGQNLSTLNEPNSPWQRPKVIQKKIGSMIVNGITISKLVHHDNDLPDETVAVLSNNDGTVTIFSLTQQAIIKRINLTKEINHASISPDGEFLVAVGDVNDVWFYQRSIRRHPSRQRFYDWHELAVVRLVSTVTSDWCFSTAWSPSGHMCIVASQFGVLTAFETSKIKKNMDHGDAIIHSMKSSRPIVCDPQIFIPSAPRSMAFSPEPWDLVAWAEDHGRITVADLRDGFASRQTIEVDVTSDKLKCTPITSTSATGGVGQDTDDMTNQRYQGALQSHDPEAALQHAVQYLEDAAARRRSLSTTIYASELEPSQSILVDSEQDSIELVPRDEASGDAEVSNPYSIHYSDRNVGAAGTPTQQPLSLGEYMLSRTESRHIPPTWSTPQRRSSLGMSPNSADRADHDLRRAYAFPMGSGLPSPFPSRLSEQGTVDANGNYRGPISPLYRGSISQPYDPDSTGVRPVLQPSSLEDHRPGHQRLASEVVRLPPGEARDRVAETMLRWNYPGSGIRDAMETDRLLREQARTWGRRINELRERAGQLGVGNIGAIGTPDLSFLDDVTNDIVLGRETISRARAAQRFSSDGEVSIQGIGWSWDGRYL